MTINEKAMNARRQFLRRLGASVTALALYPVTRSLQSCVPSRNNQEDVVGDGTLFFKISLAEWSLYRALFSKQLDHLDFPVYAKEKFGITAVEYVNQFFMDRARDMAYLKEMKTRCTDNGIESVLIMCDLEGDLGDADNDLRYKAVENHFKWLEAAHYLGCHAIRVNAAGSGSREDVAGRVTESLHRLATEAADYQLSVIVENHGGYSSDGSWLSGVIRSVGLENCGTLPDLGNFCIQRSEPAEQTMEAYLTAECLESYDRYKGTAELLPFAKGVSAKTYDFDEDGNETMIDYRRVLQLMKEAEFTGYIGIEYEGHSLSAEEGIAKTKALLERLGRELS